MAHNSKHFLGAAYLGVLLLSFFYLWEAHAFQRKPMETTLDLVAATNPGTFELNDFHAYSELFVLSDVHGMASNLLPALKKAKIINEAGHWNAGKAFLLVIGDSIDKGPSSVDVLDLWIRLEEEAKAAGGNFVHLLGNHEAEFLADPSNDKAQAFLDELKIKHIAVAELFNTSTKRGSFFARMPLAAKLGKMLFVHAGFYSSASWKDFSDRAKSILSTRDYKNDFLIGDTSSLEAKDWWKKRQSRVDQITRLQSAGFWGMVQGHQPKAYNIDYKIGAIEDGHFVKIDNGMAPEAGSSDPYFLHLKNLEDLNQNQMPHYMVMDKNGAETPLAPEVFKDSNDNSTGSVE